MSRNVGIARDGLVARFNGPWARQKLSFLDEFVPPALKATERKKQRCYVDLFAGPGKNLDESKSDEEFDGSALRALVATAPDNPNLHFTHAKLVNLSKPEHVALEHRVDNLSDEELLAVPRNRIEILNGDANKLIHRIMLSIEPTAYVFAMMDIEAPKQLQWSTVEALRKHHHQSVDAFVLFPSDMALNRMMSYKQRTVQESTAVLNAFFGCEDWRPLLTNRVTNAQSRSLRQSVLELYMARMRALGWRHVMVVRNVKRTGESGLYKMIFASDHLAGKNIASWSAKKPATRHRWKCFRPAQRRTGY